MLNTKRLIVVLVVLFGGLVLVDGQAYAYSKIENEVFKEMDKLSRNIPEGLVEQEIGRSGTSEQYSYNDSESSAISGGNLKMVRYIRYVTAGRNLSVICLKIDDDIVKQYREGKLNLSMQTLFVLKPSLATAFYAGRSSEEYDDGDTYTLSKGYDIVKYIRKSRNTPWIRYEGKFSMDKPDFEIEHSVEGKEVSAKQVQRYIDLAERFDETYSFPQGEPDSFWRLLAKGPDKEEKAELKRYFEGSMKKYVDSVLKEKPELVNAKLDGWKQTPLHLVAYNGQKEVAEVLIAREADVNAKDKHGYTPLHRAVGKGHKDVVEHLISKGADINAKDKHGFTPLHKAITDDFRNIHEDIVELLIAKEADINAKTDGGSTALYFAALSAASSDDQRMVELFRKHGGTMGAEIYDAVVQGELDKIKSLLTDNPKLVNLKDGDWELTPLHWAIICGQKEVANLLITKGADVKAKHMIAGATSYGKIVVGGITPLYWAVYHGWKDVAELLIAKGADVNAILMGEIESRTPLFCALEKGYDDIAKLLIAKGANVNAIDSEGRTPLLVAVENKRDEVVEFLKKHGAVETPAGSAPH